MPLQNLRSTMKPDRPLAERAVADHPTSIVAIVTGAILAAAAAAADTFLAELVAEAGIAPVIAAAAAAIAAAVRWVGERKTRPEWEVDELLMDRGGVPGWNPEDYVPRDDGGE